MRIFSIPGMEQKYLTCINYLIYPSQKPYYVHITHILWMKKMSLKEVKQLS